MPSPPSKRLEQICSGLCCVQSDDTSPAVLLPSEPVSARPMSEAVKFTPQTPMAPTPVLHEQVLEFERRLQSSIALIMEQQYERLSGEVLDILRRSRRSQQKTPLRTSGRPSKSASAGTNLGAKSVQPPGKDATPTAPDNAPPLLKPGKDSRDAALATLNDASPVATVPTAPGAAKLSQSLGENAELLGNSRKSRKSRASSRLQQSQVVSEQGDELRLTECCNSTDVQMSSNPSNRVKLESTMDGDVVLSELLRAASLRQKEKRAQANIRSKFKTQKVAERNSLTGELIRDSVGRRIVEGPLFDSACAMAITLNAILIGFSVEWQTTHEDESLVLIILGHLCSAFFLAELIIRLAVYKLNYFQGEDCNWNCFDFLLVMFSVVDVALWAMVGGNAAGSVGSTLKIVKMLRIVRIFRVFRFFKELSLLALMIMDSLRSLVWAGLMLTIIIYVFAICFTQNATEFSRSRDDNNTSPMDSEIKNLFGSLPKTIYSLVNAMLGGVSWGVVSDALLHMDAFSAALFFFYISFTILAVLNIITGVFVDNAVETAKSEREFMVQKETELREKLLSEMRQLFAEMDEDNSGSVSFEELQSYFDDSRVKAYFQALGLDPSDAERLFMLIDTDCSGEVQVAEFLDGCIRLKGEARSIDVNAILWQCRQMQVKLDKLESELLNVEAEMLDEMQELHVPDGDQSPQREVPQRKSKAKEKVAPFSLHPAEIVQA